MRLVISGVHKEYTTAITSDFIISNFSVGSMSTVTRWLRFLIIFINHASCYNNNGEKIVQAVLKLRNQEVSGILATGVGLKPVSQLESAVALSM